MKKILLLAIVVSVSISHLHAQRYYKAQLHCHTTNSDGALSPADLIDAYKERGYEVVFFTDHNYMTCGATYTLPDILAISGNEYSFDQHINGLFQTHTIDASDFHAQQAVDSIKAQGGLAMFNHPMVKIPYNWWLPAHDIASLQGLDMLEIFNAGTETFTQDDHTLWDSILTMGVNLWGVATDDLHETHILGVRMIDRGYVMLLMDELSETAVYEALETGNFYASTGVELSHYYIDNNTIHIGCTNCSKITFIGENQTKLMEVNGQSANFTITDELYVRVYLEGSGWGFTRNRAWTQPVYAADLVEDNTAALSTYRPRDIKLYPNPATEHLTLTYDVNPNDRVSVEITDLFGKIHKKQSFIHHSKTTTTAMLNVSNFSQGLYLLRICINGQCVVKRVSIL